VTDTDVSLELQYSRWKAALTQPGCSACRISKDYVTRYMITLVREGKSHDEVYTRIELAWGFCERHARVLKAIGPAKLGNGMSPTRLCIWLLKALSRRLTSSRPSAVTGPRSSVQNTRWIWRKRSPGKGPAKQLDAKGRCPACEDLSRSERSLLWGLQRFLSPIRGDETIRQLYRASDGLCLPHFRLAIEEVEEKASHDLLLQVQKATLSRVSGHLKEYLRKHDYRYAHEPMLEAEATSCRRAITLFVGER